MPAPKFRLQSVLDYREQLVEQRQQEFGVAERAVQAQRMVLEAIRESMQALTEVIRLSQQAGALDCEELRRQLVYQQHLDAREKAEQRTLADLEMQLEAKRQELLHALQEKQSLDRLKERDAALRKQEENYKEGQMLDEIGMVRFRNKVEEVSS